MFEIRSLLIDTNLWVDYFVGNEPYAREVMELFEECDRRAVTLMYAPTSLKDVFYLVPRSLRRAAIDSGTDVGDVSFKPAAWACVEKMTEIAVSATLSLAECELAWMLRNSHADLEDDLVVAAAETGKASYVVTYDTELLRHFAPVCVTPSQVLTLLRV